MHSSVTVSLLISLVFIPSSIQDDDRLRMCPPGGTSFTMAWSMACSMRRKRDVRETLFPRERKALVAPSIRQLQTICCDVGCSITDLLSYCGPLSSW